MEIKTKYNGMINFDLYRDYAVKSIFKILPLKEENKNWQKYLEGFLVELNGLNLLSTEIGLIVLVSRLEGLYLIEDHQLFRKIIFDCIDLVKKLPLPKED